MSDDFVTQLRLQLREAAQREERRGPVATRLVRARRDLPGPAPVAVALAVALLALAVLLGGLALRGKPEPAAPKVHGSYRMAPGLASLAPGFGAVWTADPIIDDILRIDPASRRVVARIAVPGEPRVATGAGAVWAIAGDLQLSGDNGPIRLLRIDPATNRIVARIPMRTPAGARFAALDLQIAGGVVWAIGPGGVLRIDPSRNAPDLYLRLSREPHDIAIDGENVWALTRDGRLRQYDARTGRSIGAVRVGAADARLAAASPGMLTLVLGRNQVARFQPAGARIVWRTTVGDDIGGVLPDGGVLWVQSAGPPTLSKPVARLVRLDADTGHPTGQIDLTDPHDAGMAKVGRDVWLATPGGDIVVVR